MIPKNEQTAAAKYFAMSNSCTLDLTYGNRINQKYDEAVNILYNETGVGLNEEYQSWLEMIQDGDEYCIEEWNKVKSNYVF
jgi:hypothetical protein